MKFIPVILDTVNTGVISTFSPNFFPAKHVPDGTLNLFFQHFLGLVRGVDMYLYPFGSESYTLTGVQCVDPFPCRS